METLSGTTWRSFPVSGEGEKKGEGLYKFNRRNGSYAGPSAHQKDNWLFEE